MTTRPVLVACSHGTADPAGRAVVSDLVAQVAARRPDLDVREAFVDVQQPEVDEVVARAVDEQGPGGPPVVVVPLLLSAGFHVHVDIARAVRGRHAVAASTLGPDPLLTGILETRLAEAGVRPTTPVVLAAAGSSDPRATASVERAAAGLGARRPGAVRPGYGSAASPSVAQGVAALRAAGAEQVAVATYLLAPGWFHDRLRETGADVVAAPLGPHPDLVTLVVERHRAALGSSVLV